MILLAIQTSILEIVFFGLITMVIGVVVHYLWSIRHGNEEAGEIHREKQSNEAYQWRLKYYELTEQRQQSFDELKKELEHHRENETTLHEEIKELKSLNTELMQQLKVQQSSRSTELSAGAYMDQLRAAQEHLEEHNQTIRQLLQQAQSQEAVERKLEEALIENESLSLELLTVKNKLKSREEEIELLHQHSEMAQEMKEQLEETYAEFKEMQEKLMTVEQQLKQPAVHALRYEELEEANEALHQEITAVRNKQKELAEENSHLHQDLTELKDQLREAEFQKQQIQKRNEFLEQLNKDLQQVVDYNKKMEQQMKRLTAMEDLINRMPGSGEV
ncbi:MAG: hypothetical protein U0T11_08295 [Chitinophagaceae bacterium]